MEREAIIKLFAENLRAERARKHYTQERLAEIANISTEYLARIEAGKFSPSLVVIVNLAMALDIPINRLISHGDVVNI
ncbi:MAG: helix-turn-helix transcriptional regulator [bacterium]|nr:helix-turn-helix transcriptional regulator [bacterium]